MIETKTSWRSYWQVLGCFDRIVGHPSPTIGAFHTRYTGYERAH